VAEATRERVMRQVSKLGYQPNKAARSLVTNRSNTIGIVSFGATGSVNLFLIGRQRATKVCFGCCLESLVRE